MAEAAVMGFQSQEYATASVVYSDLELAWQLQLNEALAASAAMSGGGGGEGRNEVRCREEKGETASTASARVKDRAIACSVQSKELRRKEQELMDQEKARKESRCTAVEMQRRFHDKEFARMISEMPEEEWENVGDQFERPFQAPAVSDGNGGLTVREVDADGEWYVKQACHLHFAKVREDPGYVGMAWALTDEAGHVLFQQSKFLGLGVSAYVADYTALISGLEYARSAGVKNIVAQGDSLLVSNQVSGQWRPRSPSQIKFLGQVQQHEMELESLTVKVVPKTKNKYVITLARLAIQANIANIRKEGQPMEAEGFVDCPICFESTKAAEMFVVESCSHKFCRSCLVQHVEVQVTANLVPVRCPLDCQNHVKLDKCQQFLPPKVLDAFAKSLTEASIPEDERVYCPFPNCSALMSKGGLNVTAIGSSSRHPHTSAVGPCECMECHRLFCVECKVPWHTGLSCVEYQRLPPQERDAEDIKLYQLAKNKNWQRCRKCQRMIELDQGCYHMTCRCGYEFCYTCGAEWKDKQPTCKCKLWDEDHIIDLESEYETDSEDESEPGDITGNPFYKTRMCRHWVNGHCWAGDTCRFAHGQWELRRVDYM